MGRILWVLLGLFAFISPVRAASFDCAKAGSRVEKMICGDAELSKLDEDLGAAYKTALLNPQTPVQIQIEQRQWIKERNSCQDTACVKQAYESRLTTLKQFDSGQKPSVDGQASSNENVLSFQGLGSIKLGMTVDELRARNNISGSINIQMDRTVAESDIPEAPCVDVQFIRQAPVAYEFLGAQFQSGHITRVDVVSESTDMKVIETEEGIRLESTEQDVRRIYAGKFEEGADSLESANAPPSIGGSGQRHAFVVKSKDGERAYYFETDGAKVIAMHVGIFKDLVTEVDNELLLEPCYAILG